MKRQPGKPSADSLDKGDLPPMTDEEMQGISEAVAAWTARGGHLQSGLVQPQAATEIGMTPLQYAER